VAGIAFEIAEFLVSSGVDVNAESPFTSYTTQPDGLYLQHGAAINAVDEEGDMALHVAALIGYRDAAQLLLDRGTDCDVTNKKGWTPLLCTVIPYGDEPTDHRGVAELLISRGANINHDAALVEVGGTSILDHAALYGSADVLELLLENGADLYATNDCG